MAVYKYISESDWPSADLSISVEAQLRDVPAPSEAHLLVEEYLALQFLIYLEQSVIRNGEGEATFIATTNRRIQTFVRKISYFVLIYLSLRGNSRPSCWGSHTRQFTVLLAHRKAVIMENQNIFERGCLMSTRRIFIILINVLLILSMLTLLALIIYGYAKYNSISVMVGPYYTVAFGVMLGIIAIVILVATCAICLSDSQSYCCCYTYCIIAFSMALVFIGLGVAAFKVPPVVLGDNCVSNSYFEDIQMLAEVSRNSICFSCACYFPTSVIQQTYTTAQIAALTPQIPLANSVDSTLPVKAQDCTGWDTTSLSWGYSVMQTLESHFQCTGWCPNTTSLFYRFTNVSNGIPQDACYDTLVDTTDIAAKVIGIPAIVIGSLNLLSVVVFLFICCASGSKPANQLQQTVAGPITYDIHGIPPQYTAQTLNPLTYTPGNIFAPSDYTMNQRAFY